MLVPKFLLAFRALLFLALIAIFNQVLDLDIPLSSILTGVFGGILFAFLCYRARFSFIGFILTSIAFITVSYFTLDFALSITTNFTKNIFTSDTILDSFTLSIILGAISAFTTWFFCRIPGVATTEAIGALIIGLLALSDHRHFRLDNPKILADIAWHFSIEPLSVFLIVGSILAAILLVYLFLILRWETANSFKAHGVKGPFNYKSLLAICALSLILWFSITTLFKYYHQVQKTIVANGVGQETSPGLSPLGFNSALGSTNQPSALVRLDGDYNNNPFSPMLYFRENALSTLKGTELVIAPVSYDTDLHRTSPTEPFIIDAPQDPERKKLSLSAYLLTDHNLSFAIDYPISIQPLRNPKPEKFKAAFQAVSLVPTFALDSLSNIRAGNPNWPEEIYKHYTQTVTDPRYQELALQITANAPTEIDKATAITKYLSEKSIYTLTPNHSVQKSADQVAPYLFGDLRGYCVHFAHATVFMLRSLGIPSRIGTGYLTDLSRAKDGHILLRMSDRHAWAEVYVANIGWVPFDTKPTQVESHGDSEIDMKLLEELMGIIGDDQVLLPDQKELNEPGLTPSPSEPWQIPSIPLTPILLGIITFIIINKLYLRYSWMLPGAKHKKIIRYYRSVCSMLIDLGLPRLSGETRSEYAVRLNNVSGLNSFLPIAQQSLTAKYQYNDSDVLDLTLVKDNYSLIKKQLSESFSSRLIGILNPSSVFYLIRNYW